MKQEDTVNNVSTAPGRQLGARIQEYRTKRQWPVEQLAARLGWSAHKLVRAELGERMLSALDVAVLLTECGATRAERDAALDLLNGHSAAGCWARPHEDLLPEAVPSVLFLHQQATALTCYDPRGIPGVLKSSPYIEAELRERFPDNTEEMISRHWGAQQEHGYLPWKLGHPPVCYLNERALRSITVHEDDRLSQFQHLAGLIQDQRAQLRVIPAEREHAVPVGGFTLLRFAEADPVVCVPTATATLILEGVHVPVYERVVADLDALALSTSLSADLIVGLAGGLDAVLRACPDTVLDHVRDALA